MGVASTTNRAITLAVKFALMCIPPAVVYIQSELLSKAAIQGQSGDGEAASVFSGRLIE